MAEATGEIRSTEEIRAHRGRKALTQAAGVGMALMGSSMPGSTAVDGAAHAALLGLDWSGEPPQIEVFDDLAELIFADPIHDVDEQVGWPAPRPAP